MDEYEILDQFTDQPDYLKNDAEEFIIDLPIVIEELPIDIIDLNIDIVDIPFDVIDIHIDEIELPFE